MDSRCTLRPPGRVHKLRSRRGHPLLVTVGQFWDGQFISQVVGQRWDDMLQKRWGQNKDVHVLESMQVTLGRVGKSHYNGLF